MNEQLLLNLRELVRVLAELVDQQVDNAFFRIWPDSRWPNEGETEILLDFLNEDNKISRTKFGLAQDQESIIAEYDKPVAELPFQAIKERIAYWTVLDAPDNEQPRYWEYFALADSAEYGWLIHSRLVSATLYLMLPYMITTDLKLSFDGGKDLWVVASGDGCKVGMNDIEKERLYYAKLIIDEGSVPLQF